MLLEGRRQSENIEFDEGENLLKFHTLDTIEAIGRIVTGLGVAWKNDIISDISWFREKLGYEPLNEPDTSFPPIEEMFKNAARSQDLEDWHNDISGLQTGRMTRTTLRDEDGVPVTRKNNKHRSGSDDTLDIIMLGMNYEELFEHTRSRAIELRSRGEDLQARIDTILQRERAAMQDIIYEAVTLPNGDKAFLSEDGNAYTQGGEMVDPALTEGIDWTGRPTWENHNLQATKIEHIENIERQNEALLGRIGEIQDRLGDDPTTDELEGFGRELDDIGGRFDTIEASVIQFGSPILSSVSPETAPSLELPELK